MSKGSNEESLAFRFEEPASLEDAEERIRDLRFRRDNIGDQLQKPNDGRPGYHDWRERAMVARRFCKREIAYLEDWKAKVAKAQRPPLQPYDEYDASISVVLIRASRLWDRMSQVAAAAQAFLEDNTDKNYAELERTVRELHKD